MIWHDFAVLLVRNKFEITTFACFYIQGALILNLFLRRDKASFLNELRTSQEFQFFDCITNVEVFVKEIFVWRF